MKQQASVGEFYQLSLLDEAVVLYHSIGEDFIALLDQYVNIPHGQQRYCFIGPDHLLLGDVQEDEHGKLWHVAYAAHRKPERTISTFLELAPFELDRVKFCRYHNMDNKKIYSWKSLKRISKYGLITKSNTAGTATSTCTSSTSDASSGIAD